MGKRISLKGPVGQLQGLINTQSHYAIINDSHKPCNSPLQVLKHIIFTWLSIFYR